MGSSELGGLYCKLGEGGEILRIARNKDNHDSAKSSQTSDLDCKAKSNEGEKDERRTRGEEEKVKC